MSFPGSAETEIMLLRTYSCSFSTEKTKLFFKARSTAALQNECKEFYHLVPAILRCGSVFRQKKTWIPDFHFHGAEGDTIWNIWACNFSRVVSPFLFSREFKVKACIKQCKRSDSCRMSANWLYLLYCKVLIWVVRHLHQALLLL